MAEGLKIRCWKVGVGEMLSSLMRFVRLLSRGGFCGFGGLYFLWIKIGTPKGHKKGGIFFDVM
jgi:hypothetical protein